MKNTVDVPIEVIHDDGTQTEIGMAKNIDVNFEYKEKDNIINMSRMLRYGGALGEVTFTENVNGIFYRR